MRLLAYALPLLLCAVVTVGCDKPKHFTTNVELLQVRRFGQGTGMVDLEMRYSECPGDARRVMRGDKAFAACATKLDKGDKLKAELVLSYSSERGTYRSDLVRLGDCEVKLDSKDEANYEIFQDCQDLKASGSVVGVHCNRRREEGDLLAKCPWLRRR
jgi:hypothetical protein